MGQPTWRGRVVEEANLNVQIAKLRHILDQNREHGSCIQTISGHGYRFVEPVRPENRTPIPATPDDVALQRPRLLIIVPLISGLSEDGTQLYLAPGINEKLTIDLSPITDIRAIAHNTAAAHRNEPVEIKQVCRAEGAGRASGARPKAAV
jgi:hypothetical protein